MDWKSLTFRIAVLTSLSVSLLLVLFGAYNYNAVRAESYSKQSALVEQAIGRLQLSCPARCGIMNRPSSRHRSSPSWRPIS